MLQTLAFGTVHFGNAEAQLMLTGAKLFRDSHILSGGMASQDWGAAGRPARYKSNLTELAAPQHPNVRNAWHQESACKSQVTQQRERRAPSCTRRSSSCTPCPTSCQPESTTQHNAHEPGARFEARAQHARLGDVGGREACDVAVHGLVGQICTRGLAHIVIKRSATKTKKNTHLPRGSLPW